MLSTRSANRDILAPAAQQWFYWYSRRRGDLAVSFLIVWWCMCGSEGMEGLERLDLHLTWSFLVVKPRYPTIFAFFFRSKDSDLFAVYVREVLSGCREKKTFNQWTQAVVVNLFVVCTVYLFQRMGCVAVREPPTITSISFFCLLVRLRMEVSGNTIWSLTEYLPISSNYIQQPSNQHYGLPFCYCYYFEGMWIGSNVRTHFVIVIISQRCESGVMCVRLSCRTFLDYHSNQQFARIFSRCYFLVFHIFSVSNVSRSDRERHKVLLSFLHAQHAPSTYDGKVEAPGVPADWRPHQGGVCMALRHY